jgi:hypothetical protein
MRNRQPPTNSLDVTAESLVSRVRRVQGKQVRSKQFKREIAAFVERYFSSSARSEINAVLRADLVRTLDARMQDLLRYTHRDTTKSKYISLLKQIIASLREVEITSLAQPGGASAKAVAHGKEALVMETLRKLLPTAADSFQQGLNDLSSTDRVSWRGTVVEFRESLREVLDHLAPDKDVMSMPGYKPEKKDTPGPTMKQKVMFILKSRQTPESKSKLLVDNVAVVDELVGNMVRSVYQRASRATHVGADKQEARRVRDYVLLALSEILEVTE